MDANVRLRIVRIAALVLLAAHAILFAFPALGIADLKYGLALVLASLVGAMCIFPHPDSIRVVVLPVGGGIFVRFLLMALAEGSGHGYTLAPADLRALQAFSEDMTALRSEPVFLLYQLFIIVAVYTMARDLLRVSERTGVPVGNQLIQ